MAEKTLDLKNICKFRQIEGNWECDYIRGVGFCSLIEHETTYVFRDVEFTVPQAEYYIDTVLNNIDYDEIDKICDLLYFSMESSCDDRELMDNIFGTEIFCYISLESVKILRSPFDTHDKLYGAAFIIKPSWTNGTLELLILGNEAVGLQPYTGLPERNIWKRRMYAS